MFLPEPILKQGHILGITDTPADSAQNKSLACTTISAVGTPVSLELKFIPGSQIKTYVNFIDGAYCFDGTSSYPHIEELLLV